LEFVGLPAISKNPLKVRLATAALGIDIASTQKRLGDGFYEQRLISEQIAQLTGRRFLAGYADDEAQYRALMNAGATVATAWQLVPGVALSAEQMAQLTTDIVWLVERQVSLADGTLQKVLVPQIYARVREGDLTGGGSLIAANAIDLNLTGELLNSGTIAGRQVVALSAENIRNLGRITGRDLAVQAANDLTVLGGTLHAERTLIATAGHDLTVQSTTNRQSAARASATHLDRVASLYVSGDAASGQGGTLIAAAGHDLTLLAAALINAAPTAAGAPGATLLSAGNDLTLGTVTESEQQAFGDRKRWISFAERREGGTTIQTTGDLTLAAGNDLATRAANVTSGGALTAQAGNDLSITAGEATTNMESYRKTKKSGFMSSTTKINRDAEQSTRALASTFSANSVTLEAGRDLQVKGSNVVATRDTTLTAGNNLTIEAASQTHLETHYQKTTQSGIFSSGGVDR